MFKKYNELLAQELRNNKIKDLEEYTIDSTIGRDIGKLYQAIVTRILDVQFWVCVYEISEGKYQIDFHFEEIQEI